MHAPNKLQLGSFVGVAAAKARSWHRCEVYLAPRDRNSVGPPTAACMDALTSTFSSRSGRMQDEWRGCDVKESRNEKHLGLENSYHLADVVFSLSQAKMKLRHASSCTTEVVQLVYNHGLL